VEEDPLLLGDPADFAQRMDGADFVVGVHQRDEERLVVDGPAQVVEVDAAFLIDRQVGDVALPTRSSALQVSRMALCSVTAVMMWLPLSL